MKASLSRFSLVALLLALYAIVVTAVEVNPVLFGFTFSQKVAGLAVLLLFVVVFSAFKSLDRKSLINVMVCLGLLGVALSVLLTYTHYTGTGTFCPTLDGDVPCDIVTQSKWGEFMGIPTAIFGVLAYLAMVVLLLSKSYTKQMGNILPWFKHYFSHSTKYLLILSSLALLFTIYLNYIQFVKLMTLCMLCEISATTVILLFGGSLLLKWRGK